MFVTEKNNHYICAKHLVTYSIIMKTLSRINRKKVLLCSLFLVLTAITSRTVAQNKTENNPGPYPGIYTMTQLCGEDGEYTDTPFDQYKLVDPSGKLYNLNFRFDEQEKEGSKQVTFYINRETYTTEVSEETSTVQIFDVKKNEFKLKWFNNLTFYDTFPKGTFVTEKWSTELKTLHAIDLKETMKTKRSQKNRLLGVWKAVGGTKCVHDSICPHDDCQIRTLDDEIKILLLKIYGKDASILSGPKGQRLVTKNSESSIHISNGMLRRVEYLSDDMTMENGDPCLIEWLTENRIKLTYKNQSSGDVCHEVWERVSLPVYLGEYF